MEELVSLETPVLLPGAFPPDWPSSADVMRLVPPECLVQVFTQEVPGGYPVRSERLQFQQFAALFRQGQDVFLGNARLGSDIVCDKINFSSPLLETRDQGNLWIGVKGHASHLHYDFHPGVLSVLSGRKRCLLWPPRVRFTQHPVAINAALENPLQATFCASEAPLEVVVEAGQSLLIPMFQWHFVVCEEDTVAVNHWIYPHEASLCLRFTAPLRHIVERELLIIAEEQLRLLEKPWELLLDAHMKKIFQRSLRGAHELMPHYDTYRSFVVDAVQTALRNRDKNVSSGKKVVTTATHPTLDNFSGPKGTQVTPSWDLPAVAKGHVQRQGKRNYFYCIVSRDLEYPSAVLQACNAQLSLDQESFLQFADAHNPYPDRGSLRGILPVGKQWLLVPTSRRSLHISLKPVADHLIGAEFTIQSTGLLIYSCSPAKQGKTPMTKKWPRFRQAGWCVVEVSLDPQNVVEQRADSEFHYTFAMVGWNE